MGCWGGLLGRVQARVQSLRTVGKARAAGAGAIAYALNRIIRTTATTNTASTKSTIF